MGDKPEKRGGIDVEMGRWGGVVTFLLVCSSIQLHLLCVCLCVWGGE